MALITEHTARTLHQEIDTIQTIPSAPDHIIVGTYSLIKQENEDLTIHDDEETDSTPSASIRVGSLQILAIDPDVSLASIGNAYDVVASQNLPFAVLDIRFCPVDDTLLCVATSVGDLQFFRVARFDDSIGIKQLGIVKLYNEADGEDTTARPLVTQFAWTESVSIPGDSATHGIKTYQLATCDTTGQINLVKVRIPQIAGHGVSSGYHPSYEYLPCQIEVIHKHLHNLEAWTVSIATVPSSPTTLRQILLSGGDDSCLIASTYVLNIDSQDVEPDFGLRKFDFETLPIRFWLDKQTHTAGVVAIFPLPQISDNNITSEPQSTIPILTGSYDQYIRLFLFDSTTFKFTLASELLLEGGVWRINLVDSYTTFSDSARTMKDYILLISAMHAGVYIIRLTETRNVKDEQSIWSWKIEARFTKPHESMVYACTATNALDESDGVWTIISTSFYDKRLCVWKWRDTVESQLGGE